MTFFRQSLLTLSFLATTLIQPCRSATDPQIPFFPSDSFLDESYTFKWPIRRVAIIGAGPGGVLSYREFTRAGFDVHVFERDYIAGGNWHYTEETPDKAPVPNSDASIGDFVPSLPPEGVELPYEEHYHGPGTHDILRAHRAPKPIWETMHSNAPAPIQEVEEFPWPAGSPWELPHTSLTKYMRAFASYHGVNSNDNNPNVSYNTRVELVEKRFNGEGEEAGWTLTIKRLVRTGAESFTAIWTKENFDAVVVATGRYNAPNIPDISGLAAWAERFPDQLFHSREYRRPEPFKNKTVLIIGAGTSGVEIARDLDTHVQKLVQSVRPDKATVPHFKLDLLLRRLPPTTEIVGEIKRFLPPASTMGASGIEIANGTIIIGIDSIIFSTGYHYSYPFLPLYHNSSVRLNETGPRNAPQPIVTDGSYLRNLYLDVFYIEEPTIGFVNMNIGMQSFTYGEYIAVALSKVWSGKAMLPSTENLWRWNEQHRKALGGYGKHYQYLGSERAKDMIRFFVGWLNNAAVKYGGRQLNGQRADLEQITTIWALAHFGNVIEYNGNSTSGLPILQAIEIDTEGIFVRCGEFQARIEDLVFNDYW